MIRTTGQLRRFLADAIEKVASGEMDVQRASVVNKLAAQMTESIYAEVKVAMMRRVLADTAPQMGALSVDDGEVLAITPGEVAA